MEYFKDLYLMKILRNNQMIMLKQWRINFIKVKIRNHCYFKLHLIYILLSIS